jgi:glycosyltransferase involved in cell wall biosynthesis
MNALSKQTIENVLFITAFHPGGIGFIGASEAISAKHIQLMRDSGISVHVLCFAPSYQKENSMFVSKCSSYTTIQHSRASLLQAMIQSSGMGSLLAPWLFTRVSLANINLISEKMKLLNISLIHIDSPSCLGFSAYINQVKIVYTAYDFVSQKIERRAWPDSIKNKIKSIEIFLLSKISRCIVLSEKDATICREMGFDKIIEVMEPHDIKVGEVFNSTPISEVVAQFGDNQNLVFFGNMHRIENHLSIIKFLLRIYPRIWWKDKKVRFWVIGLAPRFSLRMLGKLIPGVRIVGPVDDPTLAFQKARLCLAPIWYGAGVKIKVLQMLEAGAKVVSTPIGAEGIEQHPNLTIVTDKFFSNAVKELLVE